MGQVGSRLCYLKVSMLFYLKVNRCSLVLVLMAQIELLF